jgi:Family of unknown function (DUF5906)
MPELHFLSADVPLSKTFERGADGTLIKTPYPNHVVNFTSHTEPVDSIRQFYDAIVAHAAEGHCLLKGKLARRIENEPRRGLTDSDAVTDWVCFDLDGIDMESANQFVQTSLPPEFRKASYVIQYSASYGIDGDSLRAHLFFMLAKPVTPQLLKTWLKQLNLDTCLDQCGATSTFAALRYPIDITVCQNDKIIYISPPNCIGFEDPIAHRVNMILGEQDRVAYGFEVNPAVVETRATKRLNELRKEAGIKVKPIKLDSRDNYDLCTNPEPAIITEAFRARGFVYCNLNGGDSNAYYYPEDNPEVLHNFKGEPSYRIADLDPKYYARIHKATPPETALIPLAFRNMGEDTVYNLVWYPDTQTMEGPFPTAHGAKLKHFFRQYGMDVPSVIEDWTLVFDPTNPVILDQQAKYCNRFVPTGYMKSAKKHDLPMVPPTIDRIVTSITGDDPLCRDHFLNWLAFIFQRREKTMTAWILHGTPGTGKGVFYEQVLRPVFGEQYCAAKVLKHLEDQFNAELETNLLYLVDEIRVHDEKQAHQKINQLKNLITEKTLNVRAMRTNSKQVRNYSNFLFFSNDRDAMVISDDDRRFNVAPRQETRLYLTDAEFAGIPNELQGFADYLASYAVDDLRARTPLDNEAKAQLRHESESAFDQICRAFTTGNLSFFMEYSKAQGPSLDLGPKYRALLIEWARHANQPMEVPANDIYLVFELISPQTKARGRSLDRALLNKGLRLHGDTTGTDKVVDVHWRANDIQKARWLAALEQGKPPNVTALRSA